MFDKLSDECWLDIISFVDLKGQLALSQVSIRMHNNVQYHWRHLKEAHLEKDVLLYFKAQPKIMHEFLQSASGSLQSLVLERAGPKLLGLESWIRYSFPKMRSLDCNMWYMCDVEKADMELLLMTNLFPQLNKLTLQSSISGRHLGHWRHLKELNLIGCNMSTLKQISRSVPLRKLTLLIYGYNVRLPELVLYFSKFDTLEELIIDDNHLLGRFLPDMLQHPRFRRLAFYTRDFYEGLLQAVAKLAPLKVKSLLFNDAFWSSSSVSVAIGRMKNLRCLTLRDDDIGTKELHNICASLPHLEELHLIKMRLLPTTTELWNLVNECPFLRVLNLSSCRLDANFLQESALCLERVLKKHSAASPFMLEINNTIFELCPQKTIEALKFDALQISFKAVDINIWSSRFIEMEFDSSIK